MFLSSQITAVNLTLLTHIALATAALSAVAYSQTESQGIEVCRQLQPDTISTPSDAEPDAESERLLIARCADAVKALPSDFRKNLISSQSASFREKYGSAISAYVEACLNRDLKYLNARAALSEQTALIPTIVQSLQGVIFLNTSKNPRKYVCMGFRINTKYVATAGHCIRSSVGSKDPDLLSFALLNDLEKSYEVDEVVENREIGLSARDKSDLADVALLEIDTHDSPLPENHGDALILRPKPCSRLLIIGPEPQVVVASAVEPQKLLSSLRYDGLGTCIAWEVGRGCVINKCNTLPGFSGSPIFAVDYTTEPFKFVKFGLVGIHIRGGFGTGSCGLHDNRNIGLLLPEPLVKLMTNAD